MYFFNYRHKPPFKRYFLCVCSSTSRPGCRGSGHASFDPQSSSSCCCSLSTSDTRACLTSNITGVTFWWGCCREPSSPCSLWVQQHVSVTDRKTDFKIQNGCSCFKAPQCAGCLFDYSELHCMVRKLKMSWLILVNLKHPKVSSLLTESCSIITTKYYRFPILNTQWEKPKWCTSLWKIYASTSINYQCHHHCIICERLLRHSI